MLKSINTLQIERTMIRMEMKTEISLHNEDNNLNRHNHNLFLLLSMPFRHTQNNVELYNHNHILQSNVREQQVLQELGLVNEQ